MFRVWSLTDYHQSLETPEGWTKLSSSATNFKQRKALQPGPWDPTTHIASIASKIFKILPKESSSFVRCLKSQDSCDHDCSLQPSDVDARLRCKDRDKSQGRLLRAKLIKIDTKCQDGGSLKLSLWNAKRYEIYCSMGGPVMVYDGLMAQKF